MVTRRRAGPAATEDGRRRGIHAFSAEGPGPSLRRYRPWAVLQVCVCSALKARCACAGGRRPRIEGRDAYAWSGPGPGPALPFDRRTKQVAQRQYREQSPEVPHVDLSPRANTHVKPSPFAPAGLSGPLPPPGLRPLLSGPLTKRTQWGRPVTAPDGPGGIEAGTQS